MAQKPKPKPKARRPLRSAHQREMEKIFVSMVNVLHDTCDDELMRDAYAQIAWEVQGIDGHRYRPPLEAIERAYTTLATAGDQINDILRAAVDETMRDRDAYIPATVTALSRTVGQYGTAQSRMGVIARLLTAYWAHLVAKAKEESDV